MRHIKIKLEDIWSWRKIGYPQYEVGWGKVPLGVLQSAPGKLRMEMLISYWGNQ